LHEHTFAIDANVAGVDGIRLLEQANEALANVDLHALPDQELGEMLVGIQHEEAKLTANKARLMRAFETRRAHTADGSKTAAAWLARATNCAPGEAQTLARLAQRLPHMPATRAALTAGVISERHAQILARLYASPRKPVADAFPAAEPTLVGFAIDLSFDDFLAAVHYWESVVDADGAENEADADFASRQLHMSETWRGNWAVDGQLDPPRRRRSPH
jgi:hypothetical protein